MNNSVIVAGIDAVTITITEASTVERDAAIAGGLRECPGLRIYQDVQVGVRV